MSSGSVKQLEKALADALEAIGLEEAKGTDVSVAKRLIDKSETARAANEIPVALESVKAAKRAVEIAEKKDKLKTRLSKTQVRIEKAKVSGIETLSLEKSLSDATKALEKGDLAATERLLRRMSMRKEQAQARKRADTLMEKAKKRVDYCHERGADISEAMEELSKAEEAFRAEDYGAVKGRCQKGQEKAEQARRYARAESFLKAAMEVTREAGKRGADVTVARRHIHEARGALRKGIYADVQRFSREAKQAVREAKRHLAAENMLKNTEKDAKKEEKRKSDISTVIPILESAKLALSEDDYTRVRALTKDARAAIKDAAALRHMAESLESLRYEVSDLQEIDADSSELENLLEEAETAFTAKKPDEVRRIVVRARRAAEFAREAKQREAVASAVETIISRIGAGKLDASKIKDMLRQVEDAALLGHALNIEKMIETELQLPDQERLRRAVVRLEGIRDLLIQLRKTDVDITGADELIQKARKQLDEGRFEDAELLIQQLETLTNEVKVSLEASAKELLDRSREAITETEEKGVSIPEARKLLESAEESFKQGNIYEALEFARLSHLRAQKALEIREAIPTPDQTEILREMVERTKKLRDRSWTLQQRIDELMKADVDVKKAREGFTITINALDQGKIEEAETHLKNTEEHVNVLWEDLRSRSENTLEKAKAIIVSAKNEGVPIPSLDETISKAEQALNEGRLAEVLLVASSIEQTVSAAKVAMEQERAKDIAEKTQKSTIRLTNVKTMVGELKRANIDIADSEETLLAVETAIDEHKFEEVDRLLTELERTTRELKAQLMVAAKSFISRAEEKLKLVDERGLDAGESKRILDTAKDSLENGYTDKAIEYASIAEKKADSVLLDWEDQRALLKHKEEEIARASISLFKRMLSDLSRADIDIMGSSEALQKAEQALNEGRFADVPKELEDIESVANTLQDGLKKAATDLLARSQKNLEEAKKEGLEVMRGEKVILNAEEALKDSRFVETIEYTKVIDDIVIGARRTKSIRAAEGVLKSLQVEVTRAEALGIDMSNSADLISRAQEDLSLGRFDNIEETAKKIANAVESAQEVYITAKVKAMTDAIQDCKDSGLETAAAEALLMKAEDAIKKKDVTTIDSYSKQIEVLLSSTRKAIEAEQVEKDVRAFEDMLVQASRVGVEVSDLRPIALQAREALAVRDFARVESLVNDGKAKIRERRRKQFAERYETKMQTISTMISSAKQFGANVAEAERILSEASKALEKHDLNMADILVKQAEVSAGIQIQNFIKNRYPNLLIKFTQEGLEADKWNNFIAEVSNKGKLNARNIQLKLDGEFDVNGLEPIKELAVNETKRMEFGVKPKSSGQIPLNIEVMYQRYFDENKYELKDLKNLRVETPGTYLVEDIFLVHSDGRLITHQTRKFRQSIDEDIFSGMLTVVQDFIKDSFKQRTKIGLKRLEFGESKILLEKSKHVYLASVIIGEEPGLLSLYMAEVLREIEEKYGNILESWSGMMQELEGIDEYVAKLIFVTDKEDASLGALETSPITETVRLLSSSTILDDDMQEINKILEEAKDKVQMDPETAVHAINRAKEDATKAVEKFRSRMRDLRDATHRYVDEMKELGVDVSQAELLMREADEAYNVGKYDKLQEIFSKLEDGLDRAKDQQLVKRIQDDLTALISDIQAAKAEGVNTTMAESFLSRIQDALEERNYRLVEEYFKRAKDSLEEEKKEALLKKCKESLDNLTSMVVEAKQLGVAVEEAESLLVRASEALVQERGKEVEAMLEAAKSSATQRIQDHLAERYPRLFLTLPTGGLQKGAWNSYIISVNNKGNWPAKKIEVKLFGDVEVTGPRMIPLVRPNEKRTLELGVRPQTTGNIPIDLQMFYQRPLDDSKYELTESKEVKAETFGTYIVEDVILIHKDGRLVTSERRTFKETVDEKFSRILNLVQTFIRDTYVDRGEVGLKRIGFETSTILVEQGPTVRIATIITGVEPKLLPLYMVEVLKTIEEKYSEKLVAWDGDISKMEGLQDLLRSLFFVTEQTGADLGQLTTNPITMVPSLASKGLLKGKDGMDFIEMVRNTIEKEDFNSAIKLIQTIQDAVAKPLEEITAEVKAAVIATKETIGLELTDEEIAQYVEILRQVLQAVQRAKQKAGIETYWPVTRLAVKPSSQLGLDAVTSFRKIIVNQSLAKELDIVQPTETWRGMNIRVQVDTESLNRSYKLWAKKIEILLKGQDAWKIKSGIDKGEYAVGIDGQRVKIDREMVWFEESLPETVVEETYEAGTIYLDMEMTEDILSEGYAKEVVRMINDARKEMKLGEQQEIHLQIMASTGLYKMLRNWREFISSQTNSTDLRFVDEQPAEGYVVEATLGEENLSLSVKLAEV